MYNLCLIILHLIFKVIIYFELNHLLLEFRFLSTFEMYPNMGSNRLPTVLGKNPMRKKSHVGKNPTRKKSHEKKFPEEKIPWGKNPRGQNPIRKKSHVGKYPKRTQSHKEKNPTRKYSIVLVSLEYILRSQFSNVKNLRIFFITYPFFAHYLCFTFIVRWRACTRLCS